MSEQALLEQAKVCLEEGEYETAIALLEQCIEENPEELTYYWYLGLAYLLQKQEDNAHETWLLGITQSLGSKQENVEKLLIKVLDEWVNYYELKDNNELSLVIREQIHELEPDRLENQLCLIEIACQLRRFSSDYLVYLGTVDSLEKFNHKISNQNQLLSAALSILSFPTALSLDFLAVSIPHLTTVDWLNPVMNFANHAAYDKKMFSYAIDIANICLEFVPNNFYILNDLLKYYGLKKDQPKILSTARQIQNLLNLNLNLKDIDNISLSFGCYLLSRLVSSFLTGNDWSEVNKIHEQFQAYLDNLLEQNNVVLDDFLSGRFWALGFPLLYLADEPQQVRRYLNQTAQIFQEYIIRRNIYSSLDCSESVNSSLISGQPLRKIGYIAHTLRRHSVGWLCRWLFKYHDRSQYEIYVYLIGQPTDVLTEQWIYPNVDFYYHFDREIDTIVEQIRRDQIQILVDLDVLTHNITAQVLAHKPASVQVSWLGSDASGLPAVDYFVVDPYVVPKDAQDYYQEKLWHLPNTYLAVDGFEIGSPTLNRDSFGIGAETVVYLSVQNKIKSNPRILRLQLQIIQAVPNSLFLIKGGSDNELIHEMIAQLAEEVDLDMQRVRFLPQDVDEMTHRANLGVVDVVLDTYPYNGATTTLETLWMGIPLVTKVGEQFAARNSYTFMTNAGLTQGIAWTDEEYVDWGIRLGKNENLRSQINWKLRQSRKTAPLWNAKQFTREMEQAYQQMWLKYLDSYLI